MGVAGEDQIEVAGARGATASRKAAAAHEALGAAKGGQGLETAAESLLKAQVVDVRRDEDGGARAETRSHARVAHGG